MSSRLPRLAVSMIVLGVLVGSVLWGQRHRYISWILRLDPEFRAARHITDPNQAGPDWLAQGEYSSGGTPFGLQVIARGAGRFEARLWEGGLPGEGAQREGSHVLLGERTGEGIHLADGEGREIHIVEGTARFLDRAGRSWELERTERSSPTLGAPPPPGAIVLLDASGPGRIEGVVTEEGWLEQGAASLDRFGDHRIHLEFRTPFEPELRGQKRGNGGLYIQERYEIQILDSFGEEGSESECGALYKQRRPDVNMALPPLAWQTYDVDFTAADFDAEGRRVAPARLTVRHNGVLIHEDVAIEGPTGMGAAESASPGRLLLQDHANPIRFRNLWVLPSGPGEAEP
jgi:hypothetical protein